MSFELGGERPFSELVSIGIAIKHMGGGQNHIGILYLRDAEPRFCHLAFHFDLKDEPPQEDFYWDDCNSLVDDPVNGKLFVAKMIRVSEAKRVISYGFHFAGAPFAPDGSFIAFPEAGMGMTCATFVIAVFHSFGFPIVVSQTWLPREDDAAWQTGMIRILERRSNWKQHAEAAKSFIGVARYRPEEVAVAATHPEPPLRYADALSLAAELKDLINAEPAPGAH
jgi:hypothetical protein